MKLLLWKISLAVTSGVFGASLAVKVVLLFSSLLLSFSSNEATVKESWQFPHEDFFERRNIVDFSIHLHAKLLVREIFRLEFRQINVEYGLRYDQHEHFQVSILQQFNVKVKQ